MPSFVNIITSVDPSPLRSAKRGLDADCCGKSAVAKTLPVVTDIMAKLLSPVRRRGLKGGATWFD